MADNSSNDPVFAAYVVEERGEGKDPFWTRIGSAWANKDGEGYSVSLSALPVNGRLVLRKPKPKEQPEPEAKPSPKRK